MEATVKIWHFNQFGVLLRNFRHENEKKLVHLQFLLSYFYALQSLTARLPEYRDPRNLRTAASLIHGLIAVNYVT